MTIPQVQLSINFRLSCYTKETFLKQPNTELIDNWTTSCKELSWLWHFKYKYQGLVKEGGGTCWAIKFILIHHSIAINVIFSHHCSSVLLFKITRPRSSLERIENRLYIYEHITCRYVRLNALNVPHVPRPHLIAPNIKIPIFWHISPENPWSQWQTPFWQSPASLHSRPSSNPWQFSQSEKIEKPLNV